MVEDWGHVTTNPWDPSQNSCEIHGSLESSRRTWFSLARPGSHYPLQYGQPTETKPQNHKMDDDQHWTHTDTKHGHRRTHTHTGAHTHSHTHKQDKMEDGDDILGHYKDKWEQDKVIKENTGIHISKMFIRSLENISSPRSWKVPSLLMFEPQIGIIGEGNQPLHSPPLWKENCTAIFHNTKITANDFPIQV